MRRIRLAEYVNQVCILILAIKKLGQLEHEKARLQDSPAQTTVQAIVKARNLWIRTVNVLVVQADLAELDEASDSLIFGPLRAASKNAERTAKNKSSDAISSEPTGGAAVPPTTSTTP